MGENLGQHFLKDKEALEAIVAAGDVSSHDTVLEVGPGEGVLTSPLLEAGAKVIAVEKDPALVSELQEKFSSQIADGQLEVHESDIRDLSIKDLIGDTEYKVIANIPYYLTGKLIQTTLSDQHQPTQVVLLIQKEVAERIIAANGKESILSLSVKAYGTPEITRIVPPESFEPAPRVESAVIKITAISRDFFSDLDEEDFFSLIKRGYGHKRKTLANNLDTDPRFNKKQAEKVLTEMSLSKRIRAEKLSTTDWKQLLGQLSTSNS
jgi:16S rRNA (adenine1518-N6/adenine1519-N6)-dimethyltransferase